MINEKLLETGLSLDALFIIQLTYDNNQKEVERLFHYRQTEFLEIVSDLESKLLIKYHGGKITLRDAALSLFIEEDIEQLIDSFMDLFPKGIKNLAGHYVRSNRNDVAKKLKLVIKKYKLSSDIILKVTKNYTDHWRDRDFKYCKSSNYYVLKDNISLLADDCLNYKEEEATDVLEQFKIKKL